METKALGRVDVLAGLVPDDMARLEAGCRKLKVATGERVFAEGDDGDEVYIVRSGRVRIAKAISLDAHRTLAVVGPGQIFGELAMVDAGPRSASAEAVEPTEVLALGREEFERLVSENPKLGAKILGRFAATLAERLRLTNELLRDTVAWGLDVSGAKALNLDGIVHMNPLVELRLSSGREISGKLLKVERHERGLDLLVKREQDERLVLVPYHALVSIEFPGEQLATATSGEA
ncbi:MAG TPA: cyclic nucleotide-binding domain-containing protein [Planctomycetota bacterium]|nr:cyclic nucleotide-binding domain-containing protein [Planctomycetota bacterium]